MPTKSYLYDSTSTDKEVSLTTDLVAGLHAKQLLWVDVSEFEEKELREVAAILELNSESISTILQSENRPRLDTYIRYAQLNIDTIEEIEGRYKKSEVDFILGSNMVMTVHREPVSFLVSFDRRIKGDSDLGELDAPAFLAGLLDWHINNYFRLMEELEIQVDKIDVRAILPHGNRNLLSELAQLRQRVSVVRRILAPHREVYAAMARPDFLPVANSTSAAHFRTLADRLERALEGVEIVREMLVGSFDIFTTRMTLRTNEVMKALTLASFISFPATVIIGITSMLLRTPVNPMATPGFWIMLVSIALIGLFTLLLARWRNWL